MCVIAAEVAEIKPNRPFEGLGSLLPFALPPAGRHLFGGGREGVRCSASPGETRESCRKEAQEGDKRKLQQKGSGAKMQNFHRRTKPVFKKCFFML